MKTTAARLGLLGLGVYLVSSILKKTVKEQKQFQPQGLQTYDKLMNGYDPLAEAIGCACGGSFEDQSPAGEGLGGFGKKLKKAITKPAQIIKRDLKKIAAPVQKAVKREVKQVKRLAVTNPVNALKKSSQLVKRDLMAPAKLFGGRGSKGGGEQYDAAIQSPDAGPQTIYQDYEGNVITKEQYDALMAQQTADAGGFSPDQSQGFDQSQVDEPTYSMDQVAADMFAQSEEGSGADAVDLTMVAATQEATDAAGFTDDTFPLTGPGAAELFAADGINPDNGNYAGIDQDPYGAQFLPQDIRQNTMDAYAVDQTSGDTIIMPAGEPSMPYSADEFAVMYESIDSPSRGAAWSPEPSGHLYGNIDYGGQELPGFWQDYGGFDWNWQDDGLGAVVAKPGPHGLKYPAHMVLTKPTSTYGFFMMPGSGASMKKPRQKEHLPMLADNKGNLFVQNGGAMHRIGSIDDLCDGSPGMGCAMFGRDMGDGLSGGFKSFLKKADKVAKKVASRTTPSGFLYERLQKNPKLYKEYRKAVHTGTPYALIAAGTVISVASVGTASPAGAAMIAGGVAELGAQGYKDYKEHQAEKELDRQIEEDRVQAAIASNDVINESQRLEPSGGPVTGEIPGGDWPWEYPGDGVWADFLDLTDAMAGQEPAQV